MKNLFLSVVLLLTVSFTFAANDVETISAFDIEETLELNNSVELASVNFADINSNEIPSLATPKTVVKMTCFDFNDSCGGEWEVCYQGYTLSEVFDILWDWDGGC